MRVRALLSAVAVLGGLAAVPTLAAPATAEDLTALVNPLAGSLGPGFVTVAAGLPFGMVTPGAITTTPEGDDPVDYVGYGYQDPEVRGFALTHFSGAGVHIGGELPMMPTTGAVTSSDPNQWASPVSHATETARPGYYSTTLTRYQTTAELTATTRTAVERFTFPATTQANLLLDVSRDNDGVQSGALHVDGDRTVRGSVTVPGSGGVTIWFTARFDRPFTAHGTWLGSTLTPGGFDVQGAGAGGWVTFDTTSSSVVGARVAISYVDPAGADGNLGAEAPDGTSFDDVAAAAKQAWNDRLHAIDVTGGVTGHRATFYTNLYHALLMPDVFDDADGRYLGFDGVVRAVEPGHHHYTDLSLWDTYRTQTPLLTLVAPDVAHDVGISLLDDTDQNGGVIPKWVRGNRDYSIMGGDSGTPTLATLVTDGALTGADAQRAYDAIVHQARTPAGPRNDLGDYLSLGYIPYDHSDRGAAVTLEYAIDDASVAALAASYGTSDEVTEFRHRAESWRNLYDQDGTRFLRPRNSDGTWASPTPAGDGPAWDPMFSEGWQEGTGWQYLWLVPQDVAGLRDALGSSTMMQRLDEFFATPAQSEAAPVVPLAQTQASFFGVYYVGNQYTPANETDLQAPWLYDWLGAPAKTAQVVHAATQVFSLSPYGLPGNDDAGTMSAAYVLSTIGVYQAQPGVDAWELSTPMFDSVVINGSSGPRLTITAPGAGRTAEYVAGAKLGRTPVRTTWLTNEDVTTGQTLAYTLSPVPTSWAVAASAAPPSLSDKHPTAHR
jgi:predicted alpha-1,2-mannosidase